MTNYAKITLSAVVSTDDEYQPADHRWGPEEATSTPAHVVKGTGLAPSTPSTITIPLSDYTFIEAFMLKNTGAKTLRVDYANAGAAKQSIGAGKMILLSEMDAATDITVEAGLGDTATFEYMLLVAS